LWFLLLLMFPPVLLLHIKQVNPKGGAIALGHPLGVTGARAAASLIHELSRRKVPRDQYGIVSMCIGSGMGAAAVFKVAHATS
jgi:acetyl-CoA acetyltransferase